MTLRREFVVEGSVMALVLAAAGLLFAQGSPAAADYDEGSYLAAVDAMRHGQELGTQVFTPQPPGFYYLLGAFERVFGSSLGGVRAGIVMTALLGCVAAYLLGRALAGPVAGVAAAALLAVSTPFWQFAFRISADLPGLVIGLFAVFLFVYATRRGRQGVTAAAAAGGLFAAALSVKVSAATLLVPLAGYALARRAGRLQLLAFGVGTLTLALALVLLSFGGLHGIWHGAVSYHQAARRLGPGTWTNAHQLVDFLDPRTRNPLVWVAALGLAAWGVLRGRLREPVWPLWLWAGLSVLFLVWHRPLHANHYVLVAVALAPAAAVTAGAAIERLPRREALAAGGLVAAVLVFGYVREFRDLRRNEGPEPVDVRFAVRQLERHSAPTDLVVTDRPIIAFLADRRMPGELVDTAYLRFRSGYLSASEVLRVIDRRRVQAVVAARAFRDDPAILAGLRQRFPRRIAQHGVTLYVRR